jgi:Na+-driven multidrug efflux pump
MFVFELGLVFLLPALFGMTGIWFATDVAEILSLFLCIILILRYRERYGY